MSENELSLIDEKNPSTKIYLGERIELLPEGLLREVDKRILDGYGPTECLKLLTLRYQGPARLPSLMMMKKYVAKRRSDLFLKEDERAKIEVALSKKVDMRAVDVRNPRALMIAQLNLLCERIEVIREVNENLGDPRYEKILSDNVGVITSILEAQVKIETYLGMDQQKLKAVSTIMMRHLVGSLAKVYKTLHGEKKYEEFSKLMDSEIEHMDYASAEEEVARAVKEGFKDEEADK